MSKQDEPPVPSNVSNAFLDRKRTDQDIIYNRMMHSMWEGIVELHMQQIVTKIHEMEKLLDAIDTKIRAIAAANTIPEQSVIESRATDALTYGAKMLAACRREDNDTPELKDTKSAFYDRVFGTMVRAVILLETFTHLSETRGPQKLGHVLDKLQDANLITPERRAMFIEAIYPSKSEVVSFTPRKD